MDKFFETDWHLPAEAPFQSEDLAARLLSNTFCNFELIAQVAYT